MCTLVNVEKSGDFNSTVVHSESSVDFNIYKSETVGDVYAIANVHNMTVTS
jgi:hypothetical protein